MKITRQKYIPICFESIRGLFITLFIYTAFVKWVQMPTFVGQMERMPFPDWAAPYVAYGLPSTMLILALLLMMNKKPKRTVCIAMGILSTLSIFIILIITRTISPSYPCACAGILGLSWNGHLMLNLVYILLGGIALILLPSIDVDPKGEYTNSANASIHQQT
ncbi:MauE/DoxX family redox-associated membrane protein [Sphingobacterium sp. SYP-B4668]|uniref:MauE/DoxX family redox-associated membrane protein n=1 Tax=Sphingobacterium sp. SYP-B4668 TaxID=2996035 RepID=UPI0022DDE3F4|nr:MauE/DoxX family redox-associated membrane protein [Sphingobacterium sp. SYP-B4668]